MPANANLLSDYQQLLAERMVSRRASEDYSYWLRRFMAERTTPDAALSETEIRAFLSNLNEQDTTASAYRRAEVALELLIEGLLESAA